MSTFRGWPDSRRDPAPMQGPGGWPEVGNLAGWANIARRLNRRHLINSGLCGWWPIDEMQGTRIRDLSIYGNHGTLSGAADPATATSGWGGGVSQRELVFDGSNDYVNVPHSTTLAITGSLSCSVWCFPSVSGVYHMLITKTNGNAAASWDWYLQSSDSKPRVFMGNGTAVTGTTGTAAPTIGRWNHIAFTVSGTTVTQYLNGANNGSATNTNARSDTGADVRIGSRNDNFGNCSGLLSHARIYNRALSAAEVKQLYADPWIGAF